MVFYIETCSECQTWTFTRTLSKFLLLGSLRGRSDSKKSFAYGILYKLKVRRLMFLSTVKTSGLTAKTSLRPSHHRLYFKCVIKNSNLCVIRMTECPLLVRVLEDKACLSYKAIQLGGPCCPLLGCVIYSLTACMKQHPLILEALMYLYIAVLRFLCKEGQLSVAVDDEVWDANPLHSGVFPPVTLEPKETVGVDVRCKCTT